MRVLHVLFKLMDAQKSHIYFILFGHVRIQGYKGAARIWTEVSSPPRVGPLSICTSHQICAHELCTSFASQ